MQRTKTQTNLKAKGYKDGRRRYEEGMFPVYDATYDRKLKEFQRNNARYSGIGNCKARLIALTGDPKNNGMYKLEGSWQKGLIPASREELQRVWKQFKQWQKEQVREGRALKAPEEWPDELIGERLKAEAILDAYRWEKAKAKRKIKGFKAERQKKHIKQVLPNGPLGNIGTAERPRRIRYADGQKVDYAENGIPFIDEPSSPYHLMPIATYRQMSKQWRKEIGIDKNKPFDLMGLRERRDELHREATMQAIQEDKEPPTKKLVVTHSKVSQWIKRLGITKDDWPEWPEGAKPITELNTVDPIDS